MNLETNAKALTPYVEAAIEEMMGKTPSQAEAKLFFADNFIVIMARAQQLQSSAILQFIENFQKDIFPDGSRCPQPTPEKKAYELLMQKVYCTLREEN